MLVPEEIEVFACTDVGRKRKHNEDNFLVDQNLRLFVVADGMGGHAAGEVASEMAVKSIHDAVAANSKTLAARAQQGAESGVSVKHILSLLEAAVQRASARIHMEARTDRKKRGMGTTVSLILFVGSHGYVAHVGDSRIYLIRNGAVHQVTEDHTIANELLKLGMVKPEQLAKVPRKNAITRAVGVYEHVEVDTLTLEVLPNDSFVLASDGLCGYLDDDNKQLTELLLPDGQACVQGMIDYANQRGGKDNVTAVLVQLGGDAAAAGDMAKRLRMKREVLATMPLFRKLSERELLRILHVALLRHVEPGENAIVDGEPGDSMFVVLSGEFEVLKGQAVLRKLGSGEHFGEMALLRNTSRSATVRAAESSELVVIRRTDFFEIIRTEPHVAVKLLWQFLGVLSERLEQTSGDLRQAREELEGEFIEAMPLLLENSVEVDPFAAPKGLSTMPLSLDGDGASPAPPSIQEPSTFPGFDDAPEMATRLDPPQQIKDSPTFDDAPEMAQRRHQPNEIPAIESEGSSAPTQRKQAAPAKPFVAPKQTVNLMGSQTLDSPEDPAAKQPHLSALEAMRRGPAGLRGSTPPPPRPAAKTSEPPPPPQEDIDDLAKTRVRHSVQLPAGSPTNTPAPTTQPSVTLKQAPDADDTKKTIPLKRTPKLENELRALREQFKQRLETSRGKTDPEDSD